MSPGRHGVFNHEEAPTVRSPLSDMVQRQKQGEPVGVTSVCSAHPLVLEAAVLQARDTGGYVLVEATSNQVDQTGGYTGMRPSDFRELVHGIAERCGLPLDRVVLGGDHLGPNRWRNLPAEQAMQHADVLVAAYVAAGFTKIHLDCTFSCADDPTPITDDLAADRAARLIRVAEDTVTSQGLVSELLYVIGTEVPVPGGAHETLEELQPTTPDAARATLLRHHQAITEHGLDDVWPRIMALVVQPGVEFDHLRVVDYQRERTTELRQVLADEPHMVFEAHSTDYQTVEALTALVEDHWAVLKVGPGLTFALREALFALAAIEEELIASPDQSHLPDVVERRMLAEPSQWQGYYPGSVDEQRLTQCKGEPGAHFEDCPVVLDERCERLDGLVVGRVGLEDHVRLVRKHLAQIRRSLALVVDDAQVVELHARLHHKGHDAWPHVVEALLGDRLAVAPQRGSRGIGSGRLELFERLVGTTGHGNLGADDVEELADQTLRGDGVLRDPDQPGSPIRGQVIGNGRRIVSAAEGAVQVDLGETGGDVGGHQHFGVLHRLLCRQVPPPVGPQVVAAEHDPVQGQATPSGDAVHKLSEVAGAHAGIAAGLVHLVRRRLDQDVSPCVPGLQDRSLENQRVGGAHRGHADRLSLLLALDHVRKWAAHRWRLLVVEDSVPAWRHAQCWMLLAVVAHCPGDGVKLMFGEQSGFAKSLGLAVDTAQPLQIDAPGVRLGEGVTVGRRPMVLQQYAVPVLHRHDAVPRQLLGAERGIPVSYTHLRAHETDSYL